MSGNAEAGIDLSNPPAPVQLPYVDHPTDRPNFCRVNVDHTDYWFSYRTLVAFQRPGDLLVCRQNDWGPTTGKHLRYLGVDKKDRLSGEDFADALAASHV